MNTFNNSFITIKIVSTNLMTAREANEKGYRTNNCSDETIGYEVFYEDGYKSWCPADKFLHNAVEIRSEHTYNLQCPNWAPDYLKRMYEEFSELRDKFIKLQTFVTGDRFNQLDETQQHFLRLQYNLMNGYINILGKRIDYEYDLNQPGECGAM